MVRKPYQQQHRFDNSPIANVTLNLECRDEIVPILFGLQHLYSDTQRPGSAPEFRATDHVMGPMVAIGKGTKDAWPKPGQRPLADITIENGF